MSENRLKQRLASGASAVGISCRLGSPFLAEVLALSGFHFLYLDWQHGLTSYDSLVGMLQATARTGATPLVRVPANDPALIGHALDAGAEGIIVPLVDSADDARRAVAACRYPPAGVRSFGPLRAHYSIGSDTDRANGEVLCLVMIETRTGVEHVEEICAVTGVDGCYIGPNDLANSLGLPTSSAILPGEHEAAVQAITAAAQRHGLVTAMSGDPVELGARGIRMINMGSDFACFSDGLDRALARASHLLGSSEARPSP